MPIAIGVGQYLDPAMDIVLARHFRSPVLGVPADDCALSDLTNFLEGLSDRLRAGDLSSAEIIREIALRAGLSGDRVQAAT